MKNKSNFIHIVFTFLYLIFWAIITPPFQSPDEYRHYARILSVGEGNFFLNGPPIIDFRISSSKVNPLYDDKKLKQTNREHIFLNQTDLTNIKTSTLDLNRTDLRYIEGINYPPIYYASTYYIFHTLFSKTTNAYQNFLSLRVSSILGVTILWGLVLYKILSLEFPLRIYYWLLLNPMLGFISASLNSDAFLIPLGTLTCLYLYDDFLDKGPTTLPTTLYIWILATLMNFIKPAGLIFSLTISVYLLLRAIIYRNTSNLFKHLWISFGSYSIIYWGYYHNNPPTFQPHGATPLTLSLLDYFPYLIKHTGSYVIQYWGQVGWLKILLPPGYYWTIFLMTNIGLFLAILNFRNLSLQKYTTSLLIFFCVHLFGLLVLNYYCLNRVGPQFQGRYLLTTSICLSSCMLVNNRTFLTSYFAILISLQILLANLLVTSYYEDSWISLFYLIS